MDADRLTCLLQIYATFGQELSPAEKVAIKNQCLLIVGVEALREVKK